MREIDMYRMFQHENIIKVLVGSIAIECFIEWLMGQVDYEHMHGKGWRQNYIHLSSLLQSKYDCRLCSSALYWFFMIERQFTRQYQCQQLEQVAFPWARSTTILSQHLLRCSSITSLSTTQSTKAQYWRWRWVVGSRTTVNATKNDANININIDSITHGFWQLLQC